MARSQQLPQRRGSVACLHRSLTPNNNASLEWKGACFRGNEARLDITPSDRDEPGLGGGLLHLKVGSSLFLIIQVWNFIGHLRHIA